VIVAAPLKAHSVFNHLLGKRLISHM